MGQNTMGKLNSLDTSAQPSVLNQPRHDLRRLPPELRKAAMEGVCQSQHMTMRKGHGYQFCPWCGIALTIKHHCDHCGHDFISEDAYQVHQSTINFHHRNRCPNGASHPAQYRKHRHEMFCPTCVIVYPVKEDKVPKNSKKGPAI